MFNNCNQLTSLDLSNFKTSKVTNMSLMFYNCYSLESLNIMNFIFDFTSNNSIINMFSNCNSLSFIEYNTSLNSSFSTNIFSSIQSNIIYCLNLVPISKPIESYNCSGFCNNKLYGYEYNNTCYESCPKKTNVLNANDYLCQDLNCINKSQYYNYYQNECISEIPDGFFLNDSIKNTTDKCHFSCKTCNKKESSDNTNCESCIESLFLYLGNCTTICEHDYFSDSHGNKICYCPNQKCKECSLESLDQSLCISCNIEKKFYPIHNESYIKNDFIDCFNVTPKGYFLFNESLYEKCYNSCESCFDIGNEIHHNCIECIDDYKLTLENNCIKNCNEDAQYIYEYNNICYKSCPFGTIPFNNSNLCIDLNCTKYYNYNGTECIDEIQEGYYLFNETLKTVNKCDDKCKNCTYESNSVNSCISCNNANGYYPIENDITNIYPFINCYNRTPIGYYLLNNKYILDKRCETYEEWNYNLDNSDYNYNFSNFSYYYCPFYYYCDSLNNYYCTNNEECPEDFPKLIFNKTKCVKNCTNNLNYKFEYKSKCYLFCPQGTKISSNNYICEDIYELHESNSSFIFAGISELNNYINYTNISLNDSSKDIFDCSPINFFMGKCKLNNATNKINDIENNSPEAKDEMINNIKKEIVNGGMDKIINDVVNEKKDLLVNEDSTIYQITSTENQKNNKFNKESTLILGECENILKKVYGIKESLALLIFKIDYYQPGSSVPIIGYEVYHPVNKSKLNLNYCKNASINFNIPVSINEDDLFKYDPEHEYYKDTCYPSTTEDGTDILINDRQTEFNDNNMSLCENECTYTGYETDTKNAKCECPAKNKDFVISELINQTDILSHNFTSKEQSSNMVTMKCYYTLFTKSGLAGNIGSYILIIFTLLFIVLGLLFHKCGYPLLESLIKELVIKNEKESNINRAETIGEKNVKMGKRKISLEKNNKKDEKEGKDIKCSIRSKKSGKKMKKFKKKIPKKKNGLNMNDNIMENNKGQSNNYTSLIQLQFQNIINIVPNNKDNLNNSNKKNNFKDIKLNDSSPYYDYDLNTMTYKEALKYDKRTFSEYYFSLIKTRNYIIFSFCPNKDYNSTIVKISLFLIFFSIFYFINALFFDEPTIHKIYEDEGFYNFIYLVPHIFCSFAISHTLNTVIKFIFLSERNIYEIKRQKMIYDDTDKIKRRLIIKYICFYCIGSIFLMFLWYYLSSFGAVYQNTQIYLIKNTSISFAVSLVYPFIINIFTAILRKSALKGKNNELLFKLSRFSQYI